jgi:hypothetical protein
MIADSFMFICYAIIILGIIENIVIVFLLNSKKYKYAVPFIEARYEICSLIRLEFNVFCLGNVF